MNSGIADDVANFLNKNIIYTDVKIRMKGNWCDEELFGTSNTKFMWREVVDCKIKFAINPTEIKWDRYGYTISNKESFHIGSEIVELRDVEFSSTDLAKPRRHIPILKVHFSLYFKIRANSAVFSSGDFVDLAEEGNLNSRIVWEELPIKFVDGQYVPTLSGSLTKGIRE